MYVRYTRILCTYAVAVITLIVSSNGPSVRLAPTQYLSTAVDRHRVWSAAVGHHARTRSVHPSVRRLHDTIENRLQLLLLLLLIQQLQQLTIYLHATLDRLLLLLHHKRPNYSLFAHRTLL